MPLLICSGSPGFYLTLMFNIEYQDVAIFPTNANDLVADLGVALLCGVILSVVYRLTYKGPNYSVSFVNSLVLLSVISAIVVLVIGNNVARAFGMIGALSIIRFRTAIRDTMDLMFIFLSLAVGMAAGVGMNWVAIVGTVATSIIIMMLTFTHFSAPRRRHHLLQMAYQAAGFDDAALHKLLRRHCRSFKLVSLKNMGTDGVFEANYHLTLLKSDRTDAFLRDLQTLPAMLQTGLYFDEDDYNPPTM